MSRQVNLYEAKTQLSSLVEDAANGETIIIAKDGRPMAKLGPAAAGSSRPRRLGQLSDRAKDIDWVQWWRDWKGADKKIEEEFEAAIAEHFPGMQHKPRRKRRV